MGWLRAQNKFSLAALSKYDAIISHNLFDIALS